MVTQTRPVTIEEFRDYVQQPEHVDSLWELIDGEIIAVPYRPTYYSGIANIIALPVYLFCRERDLPCRTSGGDGAYSIGGHVIAPDFAYKRTPTSDEYPDPDAPLLAVEVISPTDTAAGVRRKRQIYLDAGILYWEVYPSLKSVDVYTPGGDMRTVGLDGMLDGGDVLPGFALLLRDIFPE
jgi:Uma2 family endonuclease